MEDTTSLTTHYLERVRQIMPNLDIHTSHLNQDGLVNDVVFVNKSWVFRFAKGDYGRLALAAELQIYAAVQGRLPLSIPMPISTSEDTLVYRMLQGEPLSRRLYFSLSQDERTTINRQLAEFLAALHAVTDQQVGLRLPKTMAPVTHEPWLKMRTSIEEKVYPLLLPHQKAWAVDLLTFIDDPLNFVYEPGLIHGDLAPYHILYDQETRMITGVIDFGTGGIGDPASDLGSLMQNFGGQFVHSLSPSYPNLERFLRRSRFYAQAIELEWVLLGLQHNENFWFTAHLGGARDV